MGLDQEGDSTHDVEGAGRFRDRGHGDTVEEEIDVGGIVKESPPASAGDRDEENCGPGVNPEAEETLEEMAKPSLRRRGLTLSGASSAGRIAGALNGDGVARIDQRCQEAGDALMDAGDAVRLGVEAAAAVSASCAGAGVGASRAPPARSMKLIPAALRSAIVCRMVAMG